ncbi:MAG TPA: DUF2934 domain-containing protein [Nitrospira sp.]|jgi:hypothetical protein
MNRHAKPHDFLSVESHNDVETDHPVADDLYARVAVLAYSFYEQRGRQDGHDVEDWTQAENTIREEVALRQNGGARKASRPQ